MVDQLARLVNEQAALRRVATLVARSALLEELFAAVTKEAGQLLGADTTTMHRYEPDDAVTVVASWDMSGGEDLLGDRLELGGRNISTLVAETSLAVRMGSYAEGSGPIAD